MKAKRRSEVVLNSARTPDGNRGHVSFTLTTCSAISATVLSDRSGSKITPGVDSFAAQSARYRYQPFRPQRQALLTGRRAQSRPVPMLLPGRVPLPQV